MSSWSLLALYPRVGVAVFMGLTIPPWGITVKPMPDAEPILSAPDLLLLDEPYSGFDWETYLRFWEMSERRRGEGIGILIVSHLIGLNGNG